MARPPLYETHRSSIFSARSFFQVGGVKPAHDNDYGFRLGGRSWRGGYFSVDASRQQMRGSVNGNVLVPRADERTAFITDPVLRPIIQHWLDAYPRELPNRPDVNARALNTNAPQSIDGNSANLRLDQDRGARDRFYSLYSFTSQKVMAFQLVAGQNPNTDTRSHRSRLTWNRQWSAATVSSFSAGFDRVVSQLTADASAVGPTVATSGLETLGPLATDPDHSRDQRFPVRRPGRTTPRQPHLQRRSGVGPPAVERHGDRLRPRLLLLRAGFRQ